MRVESLDKLRTRAREVRAQARAPEWVIPAVKASLLLFDVALAVGCFVAAFYVREGEPVFAPTAAGGSRWAWSAEFEPYGAMLPLVLPIRLLTILYYDLYRLRGEFSYADEVLRIFKATAVGSLLVVAATFLYRGGFEFRAFSYARLVFVLDFLFALLSFGALRLALRGAQSLVRRRGVNLIPTLVMGRGAEAALCIEEMRERPEIGYRVIGVIENGAVTDETPETFEGVPVIGGIDDLSEVIRETRANEVIVTDPSVSGNLLFDVMMRVGRRHRVEFRIAPSLFNYLPRKTDIDQIGALPMIRLFREPLSNTARIVKRASDIIIATVALVVLAPLWFAIAVVIRLDSRGSVFFKQERIGMDGRVFLCYKFRTMHSDADDSLHRDNYRKNIAGTPDANTGDSMRPVYGKLREDPRVTRVGRRLRRTSLDELPQLFNVLRGDMSIVGPRPPIPYEVEAYDVWHRKRLDMKPGLTGLWQVSGRNRLSFEEMVRLDLYYIENWSLLLDLKIILLTLPVMLGGDDAY
ncbi:MAG TPA: sugar transferase [Pyrinomonadaceae bacterium]|jgi:exopolysaccharide biosynthesis polyprenyl glycosylphosphotransferase